MGNPLLKTLLKTLLFIVVLVLAYEVGTLLWLGQSDGWSSLSWVEGVSDDGPSTKARDEGRGPVRESHLLRWRDFQSAARPAHPLLGCPRRGLGLAALGAGLSAEALRRWRKVFAGSLAAFVGATILGLSGVFGQSKETGDAEWRFFTDRLEVGDVIAYRKEKWNARRQLFAEGKLSVIGYRLFKYGHLAIVVEDPDKPGAQVLFTSAGGKGVNLDEGIDSLRTYNWDAYRLDKWDRIDPERIREGIRVPGEIGPFLRLRLHRHAGPLERGPQARGGERVRFRVHLLHRGCHAPLLRWLRERCRAPARARSRYPLSGRAGEGPVRRSP